MTIFKKEIPVQVIRLFFVALIIIALVAFKMISSSMIKAKIDKMLGNAKAYVTYGSASMDFFGFDVHVNDIRIMVPNAKPIIVDEMVVKSLDTENAVPRYMNVKLKGIQTDLAMLRSNPEMAAKLDVLNLKDINSNITINYTFEKDQQMIDVKDLTLKVEKAGTLTYKTKLYNIVAMEYFPMQINLAPQTIKFGETSLHYEDDSFMERWTKLKAQDANQSVDGYKQEHLKTMQAELDAAKANSQSYEALVDQAMITFMKNPKVFDFSIAPKEPVSLMMLGTVKTRDDVLKTLNPKVSAE